MAQQKMVLYSFLPSIAKVSDGVWTNKTWTNDSIYRFTNLEPYTNYNVTFYVRDSKSNKTYASLKFVNTTTGEGVPSPPTRLTVRQLIGRHISLMWDLPRQPRGRIRYYTLYHAPPLPPREKMVAADGLKTMSVDVEGFFIPNNNYSFWVTATNGAFTSNSSEVLYITFDPANDVDELVNASMTHLNRSSVYLVWHNIRNVDGYEVQMRLPTSYAIRPPIYVNTTNVTLTDIPPGVLTFIDIKAYKKNIFGHPFTIPLRTEGERDETLNFTAILSKDKKTSVYVVWSPPISDRYKNKELEYEVHYTNQRRTIPGEMSNDTSIITKNTSVLIEGLHACESYVFTVGLRRGPLANFVEIITRENAKAPVKNLRVDYNEDKAEMKILWDANCNALKKPATYLLDITELTNDKKSHYELVPSKASSYSHVIVNVPVGGRYNICVHVNVDDAMVQCVEVRSQQLQPPNGVLAWLSPNGHIMVSWDDTPHHKNQYEIIVSEKMFPEDLIHPTEDMKLVKADMSPRLVTVSDDVTGPLYVGVRTVTPDGYYSDLSEVHTLQMEGSEPERASAVRALWWGWGGALVAAAALGGALLHVLLRHRRLARSFLRFTAHTPRYDSRRGQAIIAENDDDDVPPIHGFSDDEPLVIA